MTDLAKLACAICGSVAVLLMVERHATGETTFRLADGGKALQPVVVSEHASKRVRDAAESLAEMLSRISGDKFDVTSGDGAAGIVVGLASDFPSIGVDPAFDPKDPIHREDYEIQSHEHGIRVLGATELAVEDAVWDLLYRAGYRQFFPGKHWEIVPHEPNLSIGVNAREHPCYLARRIWYGYGAWDYAKGPYAKWCAKNRCVMGIELSTGHSYDGILHANKAAFAAHPEYLGLVNGKRTSTKFCISNPGLRKLVVDYELKKFAEKPDLDSVSLDPSDGGGWCECENCAKLGSITDRALLLANEVAAAVNAKYPGKLVGMYAYNYHSPPPDIRADPHVVVSVATAFLKGGSTLDENLAGWSAKANMLGIREYYEVQPWDRDMPAQARGGNIGYLTRTIPAFYSKGARFMSAEAGDSWGPDGLGFYLASRMMWDVREAQRTDELVEDFLTRCFGPAKEPMREFYKQLDGSQPHLISSDQLGRMFRSLSEARKLANSPDQQARIDDLLLYARYADLFTRYSKAAGPQRQTAFEAVIRHAYRMRSSMMIHALGLIRDLAGRDKTVHLPAEARFNAPAAKNPWRSDRPFDEAELSTFIQEGTDRYPLSDVQFKPVAFGDDLIVPTKLNLADAPAGTLGAGRGKQTFYTRVDSAPATIDLLVTGGLIAHYRDRGNVRIELHKIGGASQTGEHDTLVGQDRSVPPDGNEHEVKLEIKEPGLYRLTLDDGNDSTLVKWNCGLPMTIRSTLDEPMNKHYGMWQMYFYVPKGTKVVGLFGGEHGEIHDSAGHPVFWLNGKEPNYYSVDVPDGQDGKVWSVRYVRGPISLLTVPPCFSPSPKGLLLPAEVVDKDAAR
ncbi:MAG TPA: DUF4838 domain-containing protein [Tepidisphaeraceae bacterium]|nr:DUF4838 domain-containing protein [Tepidisphaeraceae bacterium]